MKRLSLFLVPLLAIIFSVGTRTPQAQSRVDVPAALLARADAGEIVNVIVGVDATFVPEGFLSGRAAVTAQRDGLNVALDDVTRRAESAGVDIVTRFDTVPFFAAQVTRASLEALAAMPGVTSITENGINRPGLAQSVPLINAPAAWSAGATGAGWQVAVLDTGVQKSHPFIGAGRVVSEACFSGAGGTSLCPGGARSSTAAGSGEPCDPAIDGCDHGTHVAGIAMGAMSGGSGVAPGAGLIAVQVFSRFTTGCGGDPVCLGALDSDIIQALARVLTLAGPGNVNRVASVNMSLGGGQFGSHCDAQRPATKAAIDNLRSIGIATVIASGNDGFSNNMGSPGCISTAVSVGSTNDVAPLSISSFSNDTTFLNLLAPGQGIVSSVPGGGFSSFNGTSMATPHVAGAWAVLKQAAPSASVTEVLTALASTGSPVTRSNLGGRTHPLINVNAARLALAGGGTGVPGAPTGLAVTVDGNNISLSWSAPTSGGAPSAYAVVANQSPIGAGVFPVGNVTTFGATVPNGNYVLAVQAGNAAGPGALSNTVTFSVPATGAAPGAPSGLSGSVTGTTVTFNWTAPASGGTVSNYVLLGGTTPGFTVPAVSMSLPAGPTSAAIADVPPGTYHVRIVAQGPGGTSVASNEVPVTVAGASAPGVPVLNGSVTGNTVSLSWTPGPGGVPASYTLSVTGSIVLTAPASGNAISFPGVPSGTYHIRISATNAVGTSGLSNEVTVVVP